MNSTCHAGRSDPGRRRPRNEDRWLADPSLGLYLVADGVGGAGGGDLASQMVVDSLPALIRRHLRGVRGLDDPRAAERLREALAGVNHALRRESQKHRSLRGMGAAVVLALVWDEQVLVAHLGDCRAYLLHGEELRQLTRDHTVVQRRVDQGELTPQQAVRHPDASLLTHYLGLEEQVPAEFCLLRLEPEDTLLLCSDGLPAMLSHAEIQGILGLPLAPPEVCGLLVDTANLMGGDDNTTVVVVRLDSAALNSKRGGAQRARN